jgi:hypothetical protein
LKEKKSKGTSKNAEFYAYFNIIDAGLTNAPKESYAQKTMQIWSIFVFAPFF